MRQDVVRVEHIGAEPLVGEARRESRGRRTRHRVGIPRSLGDPGDVRGRLDAEHAARRRSRSAEADSRRCSRPRRPGSRVELRRSRSSRSARSLACCTIVSENDEK